MKIQRAYRYRFDPTPAQAENLARTFGCARVVYNWGLEQRVAAWTERRQTLRYEDLAPRLTVLKQTPEKIWLREVSNVTLQQSLRHLDRAYANFFARRAKFPQFKSQRDTQAAHYMRNGFSWRDGKITLAKHDAPLAIRWSRPLPDGADPSSVTVTRTAAGRHYVSILVEEEIAPLPAVDKAIGLDFNTGAVVDSDGRVFAVSRRMKDLEQRKRRYQRAQRRKIAAAKVHMGLKPNAPLAKGQRLPVSNNLKKAGRKVARVQERIAAIRRDWQHQLTTRIVRENQTIAIEDLAVRGMTASARGTAGAPGNKVRQKAGLNRSVLNVGFAELRRQLEYKAQWYRRDLVPIDRWDPSSKRCNACGHLLPKLPLSTRRWTCPGCGTHHDRDANAAKNILAAGLAIRAAARTNQPGDVGG